MIENEPCTALVLFLNILLQIETHINIEKVQLYEDFLIFKKIGTYTIALENFLEALHKFHAALSSWKNFLTQ